MYKNSENLFKDQLTLIKPRAESIFEEKFYYFWELNCNTYQRQQEKCDAKAH